MKKFILIAGCLSLFCLVMAVKDFMGGGKTANAAGIPKADKALKSAAAVRAEDRFNIKIRSGGGESVILDEKENGSLHIQIKEGGNEVVLTVPSFLAKMLKNRIQKEMEKELNN